MKKPSKEAREYLASIGAKGGKASGESKKRSAEHYREMVRKRNLARQAKKNTK